MNNTIKKLLIISFILSMVLTAFIYVYLNSSKKQDNKKTLIKVLVATKSITKGTVIEKNMIKEIEIPKESFLDGYVKDYSLVVGKYAKENISEDEIFILEKLQSENINELSFNIDENHRAISVNVTGDTGISYLLKPGDFVDVVVYLSEKREDNKVVRQDIAKTILQNVKVLAVDRNISRENNIKDDGKIPERFFVTLQVPSNDVEKFILAEDIGKIKLVLRPFNSKETVNTKGANEVDFFVDYTSNTSNNKKEEKYIYYTVKKGDTLRNISKTFYGYPENYMMLKKINNIKDENVIVPGMVIKIPVLN